jgi:hypothetical protein
MYEKERANIERIADEHANVPVIPGHSAPVAARIARRCATLNISPPLVIQRFHDRVEGIKGPNGAQDKIGRDFYGTKYRNLPPDKQAEVHSLHSSLVHANRATGHPYLKIGLTFIQARHLLIETYRTEMNNRYPSDLRAALVDFRTGLEADLDAAAKNGGFFQAYARANTELKIATAGPHSARQTIPIVTARR